MVAAVTANAITTTTTTTTITTFFTTNIITTPITTVNPLRVVTTLGRHSGRFGSRKSPFQVVIPSGASGHNKLTCPPPVCSTPQGGESAAGMLPILGALGSPNRQLPEFSTFGPGGGYLTKLRGDEEQRHGGLEPSGHLV